METSTAEVDGTSGTSLPTSGDSTEAPATAGTDDADADTASDSVPADTGDAPGPLGPCDVLLDLCDDVAVEVPTLGQPIPIVPSDALPLGVQPQTSNNNLDIAWWDERLFLAFRTGPTHFASADVQMYVMSTDDLESWALEAEIAQGTDVREPNFLAIDDRLMLFFAELGTNPANFEPQGVNLTERTAPGDWTTPMDVLVPGMIPWRIKTLEGVHHLLGYVGVSGISDLDDLEVHWLQTADGLTWAPAVPGQPVVLTGGVSETDFVWLDDGSLLAISRNETGDDTGFGSKLCRADADALGDWQCVTDPKKYDSPLLFRHGSHVYLVGRRNLTETGDFDLGYDWLPLSAQRLAYIAAYWTKPKRCALWEIDPASLEVTHVLDLPSRGDTCFPEAIPLDEDQYLVANYTSPLEGEDDPTWQQGQLAPTEIYAIVLTLPPAG